jgi:tetratricopeptide (TPR) repeat protein
LSRQTTIKNDKLQSQEAVRILLQVLAKAKKFAGPALLMVEFPTEYTRRETAEDLAKKLKEVDDELVDIDLRKPINLLEIVEKLKPNQVGSVHGLHAQPEVVRRLNWGRERLTDNNKRIAFWLNFEELKDLAERAPDFWAFRNRHLSLAPYDGKIYIPESSSYSHNVIELSNLSLEAKRNRAEALEELLEGIKDPKLSKAIEIRHNLGLLYSNLGEPQKALEYLGKALETNREVGNEREEGSVLNDIGNLYVRLGEFRLAIECYSRALEISRKINDKGSEAVRLGNLGIAYGRLGDIERAADYYEKALVLSEATGNLLAKRDALGNLANLYNQSGQFLEATKFLEQSLILSRQKGDKRGEAYNLDGMGLAYTGLGNFRDAIHYFEKSLAISREIGHKQSESTALGNLGISYTNLGEIEKALVYYKRAIKISHEIGNKQGESDVLANLGLDYAELSDYLKAIACLIVALNIAISIESRNTHRYWSCVTMLRNGQSDFESLLRSLFPEGDKVLQEATDQLYTFFRDAPPDTPDNILAMLDNFERQQRMKDLVIY